LRRFAEWGERAGDETCAHAFGSCKQKRLLANGSVEWWRCVLDAGAE
jgi:hypothetical protein